MSNYIESIEDARVALKAMRERAEELGASGVSVVVSIAILRELAVEADLITEQESNNISVSDLVSLIASNGVATINAILTEVVGGADNIINISGGDDEIKVMGSDIRHRILATFTGGTGIQNRDISRIGADESEKRLISRWQDEVDSIFTDFSCTVLGEKADEEAIIEQHTPFLQQSEKFKEVTLSNGIIVIVKSS